MSLTLGLAALATVFACSSRSASVPDAEQAVSAFMGPLVGADREQIALDDRDTVRSLLTEDGLRFFGDPSDRDFLAAFQAAAGVRGNPTGFVIFESSDEGRGASVGVILCYPRFPAEALFRLVETAGHWQIAAVEPVGPADLTPCVESATPQVSEPNQTESTPEAASTAAAPTDRVFDDCRSRPRTPAHLAPQPMELSESESIEAPLGAVFVEGDQGVVTAWVIPEGVREFSVAPSGTYIVYQPRGGGCYRLLRTDDGSDRAILASSLPVAHGPADAGFVATTEEGFVVSRFDAWGGHVEDILLGGFSRLTAVGWAPDGRAFAWAFYPGGASTLVLNITPVGGDGPVVRELAVGAGIGAPAIDWSPDSERLVVATSDFVTVVGRAGDILWRAEGEFACKPRWSADGHRLICETLP